jgi:hypothetical protein
MEVVHNAHMPRPTHAEPQVQLTVRVPESIADRLAALAEKIGESAGVRVSPTEVHRALLVGAIEARERELGIKPAGKPDAKPAKAKPAK